LDREVRSYKLRREKSNRFQIDNYKTSRNSVNIKPQLADFCPISSSHQDGEIELSWKEIHRKFKKKVFQILLASFNFQQVTTSSIPGAFHHKLDRAIRKCSYPRNLSKNQVQQGFCKKVTNWENFQIPGLTQATSQVPIRVEVSPLVPPAGVPVSLLLK
jgi:hypothetical protein